uniref:Transposase, MuDR, MULE transposase domain protein n=1 Tax=Tanacetum cinerariifolium TaxID=118510 RepID=A0A6L2KXD6_TANCI|nr:transposase, MuDR, MULE transposase domain protein [Tanacetum cinerariifolium]
MRPLLITDGAHLKGTYKGTNLVLIGIDENNQILHIAIGVSQGETRESWTWFLLKFKECIGEVPNLEILTDRHPAIILACNTIFLNAFHGYCCRHLMMNCKMKRLNSTKVERSRQTRQESNIHVDLGGHSQEYEAAYTNNYMRSQEYEAAYTNNYVRLQEYEAAYTNNYVRSQEYKAANTKNYVSIQEYEAAYNNMDGGSQWNWSTYNNTNGSSQGYEAAYTNFNSMFEQANINFSEQSQHPLPTMSFIFCWD